MILIIDNNPNKRGLNIADILTSYGVTSTYYKYVTGNTEQSGDWDELKSIFENLIGKNTILFIHKSNSRSEDAAKFFLEKNNYNQVIFYSGAGKPTTQILNQNFFPFQGEVKDDAKAEWDLKGFADVLLSGNGNIIEALKGTDETLEKLLEPFQSVMPFKECWYEYNKENDNKKIKERIDLFEVRKNLRAHTLK